MSALCKLPMAAVDNYNNKEKSNEDIVGLMTVKDMCKEYKDILTAK